MTDPIQATVPDVVSGRHDDGTLVTVTGVFNGGVFHTSMQGNPWVSARLHDSRTSVPVLLYPDQYRQFEGILAPTADEYRPATVTVTGKVVPYDHSPAVSVDHVVRLSGPAKHGLDHFRVTEARGRLVGMELAAHSLCEAIEVDQTVRVADVLDGLVKIGRALLPIVDDDGPLRRCIDAIGDDHEAGRLDDDRLMIFFDFESLSNRLVASKDVS